MNLLCRLTGHSYEYGGGGVSSVQTLVVWVVFKLRCRRCGFQSGPITTDLARYDATRVPVESDGGV